MDNKLLLAAFHSGVNSDLFIHKLYKKKPQTMAKLVHSAKNFMNAKDAIIAKKRKKVERMESDPPPPLVIMNRDLVQRRLEQERGRIEIIGR